ncbi:uncharacterized protein HaLaN_11975 [Haematococcus lacustris]|uniref:AAA+ ATPase domain-containing protein n=1 Tax=Haematococcus lacustris TaxID=44745 RepID=A0A699Z8Y1_HAELA|nr:uncharacterized protein HaLaN_11975 [Haematococcus lacustris]
MAAAQRMTGSPLLAQAGLDVPLLPKRGGEGAEVVVAAPSFRLLATMNPGGDYGKKELSPALANRFTTVWVPPLDDEAELLDILKASLAMRDLLAWATFVNTTAPRLGPLPAFVHGAHLVLLDGLGLGVGVAPDSAAALRSRCAAFLVQQLPPGPQQAHARLAEGRMEESAPLEHLEKQAREMTVQLQGGGAASERKIEAGAREASAALANMQLSDEPATATEDEQSRPGVTQGSWGLYPFYVPSPGPEPVRDGPGGILESSRKERARAAPGDRFELSAPTAARNAFRVLRALALRKAVLLEGSPGVGKTALVAALAKRAGIPLVRINLSEQTDMMDLLGADLPAPGGQPGQFTWCDGALLGALKAGHWVLLDELNLAGQSVLEGLNALLDHRAENPLQEGGGRKGLPRSFLNRFTRVHIQLLGAADLTAIATALHTTLPPVLLARMVRLLGDLETAANGPAARDAYTAQADGQAAEQAAGPGRAKGEQGPVFGAQGGPWEFNLRDLLRWADLTERSVLLSADQGQGAALEDAAEHFAMMLFSHRLRTEHDRLRFAQLWDRAWGKPLGMRARSKVVASNPASQQSGPAAASGLDGAAGPGRDLMVLAYAAAASVSAGTWQQTTPLAVPLLLLRGLEGEGAVQVLLLGHTAEQLQAEDELLTWPLAPLALDQDAMQTTDKQWTAALAARLGVAAQWRDVMWSLTLRLTLS